MLTTCFRLACAASVLAAAARAQCPEWSPDFGYPGVFGDLGTGFRVSDMTIHDDGVGPELYVAGNFHIAGDVMARNVARWDGSRFWPLGLGVGGYANDVNSFDHGAGARLYVSGHFSEAGGASGYRSIAGWDGAAWFQLGAGISGRVLRTLAADLGDGPSLYVCGDFNQAGDVPTLNVARWDGSNWHALPGWIGGNGSEPRAMAVFDAGSGPQLYVGALRIIRRWTGSTWEDVASVGVLGAGLVYDMKVHDDGTGPALYVGGKFPNVAGVVAPNLARWDGSTWSAVGVGMPLYPVSRLASGGTSGPFAGRLIAAGMGMAGTQTHAVSWDGNVWSALDPVTEIGKFPSAPNVLALAILDGLNQQQLILGGDFNRLGQRAVGCLATWDGAALTPLVPTGAGARGKVRALKVADLGAGPELFAGGEFTSVGSTVASFIARFDGHEWSALGSGVNHYVEQIEVHDDGSGPALYAAGQFTSAGGVPVQRIARWDGVQWSEVGGEIVVTSPQWGVLSLASFDDGSGPMLYAGGAFTIHGRRRHLARWDGVHWHGFAFDEPLGEVRNLFAFDDGQSKSLIVAGSFSSIAGGTTTGIARFDGQSWSSLGAGLWNVQALTAFDTGSGPELYAAGLFTVGGSNVAKFNGSGWVGVGASANLAARSLAVHDDGHGPALYLGGDFTQLNGAQTRHVARWNGATWSELDVGIAHGTGPTVRAMATYMDGHAPNGSLYLGGSFSTAGGRVAINLASWRDPCACRVSTYCTRGVSSSGCVPSISSAGQPSASSASSFTIHASNLEGGRSGYIFYGLSGPHAAAWGASSFHLCVKSPTQRTPSQQTGGALGACDGALSIDWNQYLASSPGALGQPFGVGQTVWAQCVFRDPDGPKGTALTDGLEFVICP